MKSFLAGLMALGLLGSAPARADIELKVASLAPKGSPWAKIMERGAANIDQKTESRVKIKYFFSAQQGDERNVVAKMKLGQLDGAALTAVGLGLIAPNVRVLELPFLFDNEKELDYVREKLRADFEQQFDAAGYRLISWGDVGWVHLYSNQEVGSRTDLTKTKMWAWVDDPIVRELFKRLGVNGVPLGVPDVLPNLQTGVINACYGPPAAAVGFQWHTKVRYATGKPISYAIGAFVVRKDVFNKLSPNDQQMLLQGGTTMGTELMKTVRKENDKAKKAMQVQGIKFSDSPADMLKDFEKEAQGVWAVLTGKLYPQGMLDKVLKYRSEVRGR